MSMHQPIATSLPPGFWMNYLKLRNASLFPADSATHSLLVKRPGGCRSLPAVNPVAPPFGVGKGNSVIVRSGVTRPTRLPLVNHTLRSGPTATLIGDPVGLGIGNSVMSPFI